MISKVSIVAALAFITGCVHADLVQRDYREGHRGGTIKYLNQGADSVIESRRRDGESKMREFCGGGYDVETESAEDQDAGFMAQRLDRHTVMATPLTSQYVYLNFRCSDQTSLR